MISRIDSLYPCFGEFFLTRSSRSFYSISKGVFRKQTPIPHLESRLPNKCWQERRVIPSFQDEGNRKRIPYPNRKEVWIVALAALQIYHLSEKTDSPQISWKELQILSSIFQLDLPEDRSSQDLIRLTEECFQHAYQACLEGKWDTIKQIKDLLPKLTNKWGYTLFLALVFNQQLDTIKDYIAQGLPISQEDALGNSALHLATAVSNLQLLEILLEHFNINQKNSKNGQTPLHVAIENDQLETVSFLISRGASLIAKASYVLYHLNPAELAVYFGRKHCFDLIASKSFNLSQTNSNGTLLHLAISANQTAMLSHLLNRYGNAVLPLIENRDFKDRTPLMLAAYLGATDAIELLYYKGANLEAQDRTGKRAIFWGVLGKQKEATLLLISLGAKLDVEDFASKRPETYLSADDLLKTTFAHPQNVRLEISPSKVLPQNLTFQGGGKKHMIAYAGALRELERVGGLEKVVRVAGTSTGTLIATLIAIGYSPTEVEQILSNPSIPNLLDDLNKILGQKKDIDFNVIDKLSSFFISSNFIASNFFGKIALACLMQLNGLKTSDHFRAWIERQIYQKTGIHYCTFKELRQLIQQNNRFKHLHVFAVQLGKHPELVRFSTEDPRWEDLIISDAVTMATSLPGLHKPHHMYMKRKERFQLSTDPCIDSSLLFNNPITAFDTARYKEHITSEEMADELWINQRTWGLSLNLSREKILPLEQGASSFLSHILTFFIPAKDFFRESQAKDDRIIEIRAEDIDLSDFALSPSQRQHLIKAGEKGVASFLQTKQWDTGRLGDSDLLINKSLRRKKKAQRLLQLENTRPDFVGRVDLITLLEKQLIDPEWDYRKKANVRTLVGAAGVGKSELAKAFANTHLKDFSLIWRIDAETQKSYANGYRELAQALKISILEEEPLEYLVERVHRQLEQERSQPYLLLLDHINTPQISLPTKGGAVLITCRFVGEKITNAIHVPPFSIEESVAFLKKVTGEPHSLAMETLVQELDCLPLSISASAYLIKSTGSSIAEFQQLLKEKKSSASRLALSMDPVLDIIQQASPLAMEWLIFCAYLKATATPRKWLDQWLEFKGLKTLDQQSLKSVEMLRILQSYSLVHYDKESNLCSIRPSILQMIQSKREKFRSIDLIDITRFLGNFGKAISSGSARPEEIAIWKLQASFLAENEIFSELNKLPWDKQPWESLSHIGYAWLTLGDFQRSLPCFEQVLKIQKKVFKNQPDPALADTLSSLGTNYLQLGDFKSALTYLEQALEMQQYLSKEKPNLKIAIILSNLGSTWMQLENYSHASSFSNSAYRMLRELLSDASHPSLATSLYNLGFYYMKLGKPKEGLNYAKQALRMQTELFGKKPQLQIAKTLDLICENYIYLGEYHTALEYAKQGLAMQEEFLGKGLHPEIALSLNKLGVLWGHLGKHHEAVKYHEKALVMQREFFQGRPHPELVSSLNRLGEACANLEKYESSLNYHREALNMQYELFGEKHSDQISTLNHIGSSLLGLGRYQEALIHTEEAFQLACQFYKKEDSRQIEILKKILVYLKNIKDKELIEKTKANLLPLSIKVLGKDHELTRDLRKIGEARAYEEQPPVSRWA